MRFLTFALAALLAMPVSAQEVLSPEEANARSGEIAEAKRQTFEGMSFEDYRDSLPRVEGTGSYVVNGDVTVRNEKLLLEFFQKYVQVAPPTPDAGSKTEAIVMNVGGVDKIWNSVKKRLLTYCVSDSFGPRHPLVVSDMEAAAAAFEAVADLDFIYVPGENANCDQNNDAVMFDVRPVNANGQFLAAAFFPDDPRNKRSVVIDPSSFNLDPNGLLTLRGILRHELGHTIGLRHEHTRPEAGACFEDNNWRVITNYDIFSVMHYPHCNGSQDWSLRLTDSDKAAVACLYGAAAGFAIDPALVDVSGCVVTASGPVVSTQSFGPFSVPQGGEKSLGTFDVAPGSVFTATMSGSGDPDLYVAFGGFVGVSRFDCRPYSTGANETCELDVPSDKNKVSVMVRGYQAGEFSVEITHTAP